MPDDTEDMIPEIQLRIPGLWRSSDEVKKSIHDVAGDDWRAEEDGGLINIATGQRFQLGHSDHDDDIAQFFADTGRMSDEDVSRLATHPVKVHVTAPGGSVEAACAIMDAARVLIEAGGYGLFVDNSGIAHPPEDWRKLTDSSDNGGVFWAFVSTTAGFDRGSDEEEMFSTGMHCLGYRDAEMPCPPDKQMGAFFLNNFLGYCYQSGRAVIDGDSLNDLQGPLFRAIHHSCTRYPSHTAFFNPYGIWRLEPVMEDDEDEPFEEN
jgi:hypothetical protein